MIALRIKDDTVYCERMLISIPRRLIEKLAFLGVVCENELAGSVYDIPNANSRVVTARNQCASPSSKRTYSVLVALEMCKVIRIFFDVLLEKECSA